MSLNISEINFSVSILFSKAYLVHEKETQKI